MSDDREGPSSNGAVNDSGVLANLPRARPQRASARRAAARNDSAARKDGDGVATRPRTRKASVAKRTAGVAATAPAGSSEPKPGKRVVKPIGESAASSAAKATLGVSRANRRTSAAPPRASTKRAKPIVAEEPAPRQGYECEHETPTGAVQPPAGVELAAAAAEIVGELAKAGVATGERLLRDALSRLPL